MSGCSADDAVAEVKEEPDPDWSKMSYMKVKKYVLDNSSLTNADCKHENGNTFAYKEEYITAWNERDKGAAVAAPLGKVASPLKIVQYLLHAKVGAKFDKVDNQRNNMFHMIARSGGDAQMATTLMGGKVSG